MSRLTRREMKRDEVREGLGHIVDYIRDHGRELVLAIAAVAVLAAAIGGWLVYRAHRDNAANELLARAIQIYEAPIDAVAARPDDEDEPSFADVSGRAAAAREAFEEVRDRFGGSRLAGVAAAYLADLAIRDGDMAAARALWEEAGKAGGSALTIQMIVNELAADRAEGRAEEALARLEEMLDSGSGELPEDMVLDEMARTLETLGRDDEALDLYERLLEDHPQSAYSTRARERTTAP